MAVSKELKGRATMGLGIAGGLLAGLAMLYGAAATIGIPLPKPVFDSDLAELRRDVASKYDLLDRRLTGVETRQIKGILVSLGGQLRQNEREIERYRGEDVSVPRSALRERDRLKQEIEEYKQLLLGSP